MSPVDKTAALFALARRLDATGQEAAATRLRGAALSIGVELVPLFELLVGAAEDLHRVRGAAEEAEQLLADAATHREIGEADGLATLARLRAALGVERG